MSIIPLGAVFGCKSSSALFAPHVSTTLWLLRGNPGNQIKCSVLWFASSSVSLCSVLIWSHPALICGRRRLTILNRGRRRCAAMLPHALTLHLHGLCICVVQMSAYVSRLAAGNSLNFSFKWFQFWLVQTFIWYEMHSFCLQILYLLRLHLSNPTAA